MARIICVANQKGGVGKTTTSVNLAAALVELGHRVMIVDMDPQGNASSGLGVKRYVNLENNIYQVLIGEKPIRETIQATNVANLDIIPANPDLVGAEIELVDMPNREYRLRACLEEVRQDYKYILIDCPPSLGLLTVNSLSAAETFLVPLQCEYYALEGLSQLLNTAGLIKKSLNQELRIEGIVLTMFDARNNLSHQVVAEIQSHFGDKVFQAIIPRNVRLSEAPSHGQTIFQYDTKSLGAKRYRELAQELDQRVYGTARAAPKAAEVTQAATATATTEITPTEPAVSDPAEMAASTSINVSTSAPDFASVTATDSTKTEMSATEFGVAAPEMQSVAEVTTDAALNAAVEMNAVAEISDAAESDLGEDAHLAKETKPDVETNLDGDTNRDAELIMTPEVMAPSEATSAPEAIATLDATSAPELTATAGADPEEAPSRDPEPAPQGEPATEPSSLPEYAPTPAPEYEATPTPEPPPASEPPPQAAPELNFAGASVVPPAGMLADAEADTEGELEIETPPESATENSVAAREGSVPPATEGEAHV